MLTPLPRTAFDCAVAGVCRPHLLGATPAQKLAAPRLHCAHQKPRRLITGPNRCSDHADDSSQVASAADESLSEPSLAVDEAWRLLLCFNDADMRAQRSSATPHSTTREQRNALRQAVLVAVSQPWPEAGWDPAARPAPLMLGVLSGDVRLGVRALRDWAQALGFEFIMPQSRVAGQPQLSTITGGVYIKHNVSSASATASDYSGGHRGVLLQLGQQQIGHLPLGLFDEARSVPPPVIS